MPELRFAGFSGEWMEKKIKNISTINSGKDYKHLQSGNIPVYGTGGLMTHVNKYLSEKDSIGIGRKGTINRPYILNHPFWTVDTLFFTTPNIETNLYFLYGIYQNINWLKYDESSGLPSLSKKNIENLVVSVPNIKEQEKIGDLFSKIDQLIESQQELVDQTMAFKKSMLQKMFPKKDSFVPEFRFYSFKEHWNSVKIGNFLEEYKIKTKTEDEYDMLSSTNTGVIYRDRNLGVKSNVGYKVLDMHDLVLSPQNLWLGNININELKKGIVSPSYYTFKIRKLDLEFLKPQLKTKRMLENYKNASMQGASVVRRNLEINEFYDIKLKIPSPEEQEKIGNFFKNLDEKIAREEKLLDAYKDMKKSLLQKMFV